MQINYRAAITLLISLSLLGGAFYWGYATSSNKWSEKWLKRDADDLQASLNFAAEQSRIERERNNRVEQIQKDAENESNRLNADLVRSRAESGRLQQSIRTAIGQLRSGTDTAVTGSGKNARAVGVLLSDLYAEINHRSNELAGEADRYYLAGLTCNRQWEAVRGAK